MSERGDGASLSPKSADGLNVASRNFYENSTFKIFLSIVYFALSFFMLGLCSQAGGISRSYYYQANSLDGVPGDNASTYQESYDIIVTGYGFAAFFYFVAFALMFAAGFHISPLTNGSVKERITIRTPIDVDRTV